MWSTRALAVLLTCAVACAPARAGVVINEIFYHAPDDLDNLQFVELHNTGAEPVDLAGWKLEGVRYTFPAPSVIPANGFLVVCKDRGQFRRHYGFDAAGAFDGTLSRKEMRIGLVNAQGKKVESVKYESRAPWPVAADGYSSSLERVCPTSPVTNVSNWAPSPLAPGAGRPGGTPGKKNTTCASTVPPSISKVKFTPPHVRPNQAIDVEAAVRASDKVQSVELRYRVAGSGFENEERTVAMKPDKDGRYTGRIPAQKAGQIVRFRIRAVDAAGGERLHPHPNDLRPALSVYVHDRLTPDKAPWGFVINIGANEFRAARGQQSPFGRAFGQVFGGPPARGRSAFVYVSAKTGEPQLFDYINVTPRNGGRKVRFHKDRPLDGMTTINLIFESLDRFVLAEPLAYDVFRKAGNAACRTDWVRTWIDGQPIGYQLLIEQPNKAFLRHNGLNPDGNLYKIIWYGNDLVSQHEKKTHVHSGHQDLIDLDRRLRQTRGDEQWAVIKKNFDVEQVINYFAVNMVLSHWDGYFNNYFTYHDPVTGKWTMYPWDQDKTWGFHDGIQGYDFFFDMPLTFGMEGDVPPGWPKGGRPPGGIMVGTIWWRPGGVFSKPLLANPQFRQLFLARTKEVVDKVYTEDNFFPLIQQAGERLEPEVKYRAKLYRQDPEQAVRHLQRNLDSLREHLTKRRQFLLEQDELKKAGKFDRAALK